MQIFLNGGGDGIQTIEANKKLNEIIDHTKPLLYIPLAMESKKYLSCFEWIKGELKDVDVPRIDMITSTEEIIQKDLYGYSAIFIGGGNTFKLLNDLKVSGAFEKIKEYILNNGIIFGGSAGAIIFGNNLKSCALDDENEVGLEDISGFDVLDGYSLLCHYTNRTKEKDEESKKYLMELSKKEKVIALPEEDTIFINNGNIEIIGTRPYYIFEDGNVTEIKVIESIELIPYKDEYYDFVYGVKKIAYKKYVEECWGAWNEKEQEEYFARFINQVRKNAYIIRLQGKNIGFYNGELLQNSNYEIGNICIIPEYQGRGIGTKLLKEIIKKYEDTNIEIQYFKQNQVGNLYKRLGFVLNGETEFHYKMIKKNKIR